MTRRSPTERISAVDASSQLEALARVDAYLALITDPWDDVAVTAPLASGGAPNPPETATQVLMEPASVQERAVRHRRRPSPRHVRQLTIAAGAMALVAGVAAAAPWSNSPSPVTGALGPHVRSHTVTGVTTSTSVSTSTVSTTSTASNSASRGVVSAATVLDTAITAGENNGTISVAAAPPLIARVSALLTSSPTSSPTQAQQLAQVLQQFEGDVHSGQIVGGTIGVLATSIEAVATALGSTLSISTTTNPPGVGGPAGPGQGHGLGHGQGHDH